MKCIAVQDSLGKVREELENRGYKVVPFEFPGHVDAIIYENSFAAFENINTQGNVNEFGAIIINAHDKPIEDIIYIIENRRYGSILY